MNKRDNLLDLSTLGQFSDIMKAGSDVVAAAGKPLSLALDRVEEDPRNARKKYDSAKMQELADAIRANGLTTPIVVKVHPDDPNRYQIVHGHRRYRAHKLIEATTIEAVVTDRQGAVSQLVDNLQREDLTPAEVVGGIRDLLADGLKQTEIAQQLGKSKAWVSKHAALTELADVAPELQALLDSERVRDASTLYELLQVWKKDATATAALLAGAGDRQIVQADVEGWRASILRGPTAVEPPAASADAAAGPEAPLSPGAIPNDAESAAQSAAEAAATPLQPAVTATAGDAATNSSPSTSEGHSGQAGDGDEDDEQSEGRKQNVKPAAAAPDPTKVRKPLVQVRVGRREAVLLIGKKAAHGLVWVQYEDGTEDELDVAKVKLVAVTEGAK